MNDCIEWTRKDGKKTSRRYGAVVYQGKVIGAHCYAWIISNGSIPSGMFVCHTCDNGLCININHLFIGTPLDNMSDKIAKGRHKFGNITKVKNGLKPCSKCLKTKKLSEFSPNGRSKRTGIIIYHPRCKVCRAN